MFTIASEKARVVDSHKLQWNTGWKRVRSSGQYWSAAVELASAAICCLWAKECALLLLLLTVSQMKLAVSNRLNLFGANHFLCDGQHFSICVTQPNSLHRQMNWLSEQKSEDAHWCQLECSLFSWNNQRESSGHRFLVVICLFFSLFSFDQHVIYSLNLNSMVVGSLFALSVMQERCELAHKSLLLLLVSIISLAWRKKEEEDEKVSRQPLKAIGGVAI